jgi:hypothetical protein
MDPTGAMRTPLDQLIEECQKTWPMELASVLTSPTNAGAVAVRSLISRAREGEVATLPYVHRDKGEVYWLSFGAGAKSLLEYGEDLKSWVMPGYETRGDLEFVSSGSGRLANLVHQASPAGYLRWTSNARTLQAILSVLDRMHSFLKGMPEAQYKVAPSLHVLRFRFVTALRLGQWSVAESVVDEIDRWNLEQAHKTMQMRLRILGQSGGHAELLELVERHNLWALTLPTRVAESVLDAVVRNVLLPMEKNGSPAAVCEGLRPWYTKLTPLLSLVRPTQELGPLFAYIACIDNDAASARALTASLNGPLSEFVRSHFWANESDGTGAAAGAGAGDGDGTGEATLLHTDQPIAETSAITSEGSSFWRLLQALVRNGAGSAVRRQLEELDAQVMDDAEFLSQAPEALLELISDPEVDAQTTSRLALQEVLSSLIDTSLSAPHFPSLRHLDLYLSLTEALVYLRGSTAADEDAHLLHGMLAAIANLSPNTVSRCVEILRNWWLQRPILSRLDWLIAVLDSLAPLHPDPACLLDLWSEAVALATRKRTLLSPAQLRNWRRVAALLEIPAYNAENDLAPLCSPESSTQVDVLRDIGWRKIAIVSLQEGAAREAARELQARTGAEVVLVTGLVQDGLTKAAQMADVVLLVWAACTHAVYRAFDDYRERLVYVQGTGTSSIVSAAERQAEMRQSAVMVAIA